MPQAKNERYYWIRRAEHSLAQLRHEASSVVVLPLGSIESHGPHLPLGSDPLIIDEVVERILPRCPVAVLPTLHYSYVAAARMLPGAIHMPTHLLMEQVEQICSEVHRNGFAKIVLLHGHGGNVALHWMICNRALEREAPYALYSIPVFAGKGDEVEKLFTSPIGHACEMETAVGMVAYPQLVNLAALGKKTFPEQKHPQVGAAATPVDWVARYPEMAVGEPQKATRENGEKAMSLWVDGVVEILEKIKLDQVVPAQMKKYAQAVHAHRGGKAAGSRPPGKGGSAAPRSRRNPRSK